MKGITQFQDIALWRFSIISPLLHQSEESNLKLEMEKLAAKTFVLPDGATKSYSTDTFRKWLYEYRKRGVAGLATKSRKDKGQTNIPLSFQEQFRQLRKQYPQWTTKRILESMLRDSSWDGIRPSKSAIYRFTQNNGLNRNLEVTQRQVRSFEFPHFGDLWSADFLHGPKVSKRGKDLKVYLHAIIDDSTRYIVAANFHPRENTHALVCDLQQAVRRFGIPKRFYTDNGSAFRSRHLIQIAARLGVSLPHTPAYTPQGRGKIERFFRTVRDSFLTGKPKTTLDKLNSDFKVWLAQYHRTVHSALQQTPLEKKATDDYDINQLDWIRDTDSIFRMEQMKTIYSDGCIRLNSTLYDVPQSLPGQKVKVSYVPWDPSVIYVGEDQVPVKPLNKTKNAHRFENPKRGK